MTTFDRKEYLASLLSGEPQPETTRYLDVSHHLLGMPKEKMKVLDYGCGVGSSVRAFSDSGYDVYGADIDDFAIQVGNDGQSSLDPEGCPRLRVMDKSGHLPFPDDSFDFVYSQEVFEHIEDLDMAAAELNRVTKPGGLGFHVYRAPFEPIEPHYFMPIVHWLPKNNFRKAIMTFWLRIGIGKGPREIPDASIKERAERLYKYSVEQTFFYPTSDINKAFHRNGMDTLMVVTNHRKLRKSNALNKLLSVRFVSRFVEKLILTFHTGTILTRKTAVDCSVNPPSRVVLGGWSGSWQLSDKARKNRNRSSDDVTETPGTDPVYTN